MSAFFSLARTIATDFLCFAAFLVGALVMFDIAFKEIDAALFARFGYGADSSDTEDARSGMAIKRDALTGCEYLVSPWGGVSPRLDQNGSHICRGGAE